MAKHRVLTVFGSLLIITGLCLFLYPDVAALLQSAQSDQIINEFEDIYSTESEPSAESDLTEEPTSTAETEIPSESEMPFQDLYNAIVEYNEEIYNSNQAEFKDAWCYTQSPVDIDCLDNELFGYIEIPAMDVKLPLYIGASTSNMAKGATIMGQTSIPIGGTNTNSVIAGHRGYRGSPYFREIEKLSVGDYVYITNPWETLVYQAVEIRIIDPYDAAALKIQEGKELITLLTCHPYMSGGKYRYLVFCERVEDDTENAEMLPDDYKNADEQTGNDEQESYVMPGDSIQFETSQDLIDNEKLLRRGSACFIGILMIFVIVSKMKNRKHRGRN